MVRLKFKVADKVRISKKKGKFEKGYLPNWTEKVSSIAKRLRRIPPVYRLREYDRTMLEGTFYEHEPESNMFRIEKILKVRGKGKHVEYLVRWSGWRSKYDQWLPASSLKRVTSIHVRVQQDGQSATRRLLSRLAESCTKRRDVP